MMVEDDMDLGANPVLFPPHLQSNSKPATALMHYRRLEATPLNHHLGYGERALLWRNKGQNWGHVDNSRFNIYFICVDASLSALDLFVDKRVDHMIESGLLEEVFDIYQTDADYTKGFRQAIGVREFNDFLTQYCFYAHKYSSDASGLSSRPTHQRRRRRIQCMQMFFFGWEIHYIDATRYILATLLNEINGSRAITRRIRNQCWRRLSWLSF
ncbi:unnamed protein product [Cuscuta campestris]|uniref:Uncharacterized protein n=1 Tax=Cuscuta campestris TaxID=132261 RepID=A0A484M2W5_9ASTE|nr:unnamed protein product [Cuscuta campestris]